MAGWHYRTDIAEYYRSDKTAPVTQADLRTVRNQLADGLSALLAKLADAFHAGRITLAEWAERFAALIRQGTTAGWLLGSGGQNAVTRDALAKIDSLIARQTPFAESFVRELGWAQLGPAETAARAQLYAGTAVTAYEQAMSYRHGIDLPTYPGMDSSCGGNCRCSWTIETTETEVMAWWDANLDAQTCPECAAYAGRYNPLVVPR